MIILDDHVRHDGHDHPQQSATIGDADPEQEYEDQHVMMISSEGFWIVNADPGTRAWMSEFGRTMYVQARQLLTSASAIDLSFHRVA